MSITKGIKNRNQNTAKEGTFVPYRVSPHSSVKAYLKALLSACSKILPFLKFLVRKLQRQGFFALKINKFTFVNVCFQSKSNAAFGGFLQKLLIILLFCTGNIVNAGIDPVTVIVNLSPPYSPYLNEYAAEGSNKLQLTLIINDSRMLNYPSKLQMVVEKANGGGVVMYTGEFATIAPIYLTGQTTEILTGADLAPFFMAQNNAFTGFDASQYIQTGRIPDGQYRIGFRVVDAQRNDVFLSNTAYSQPGWFVLNDPPVLNLPRDKEEVRINEPQFLKLEWFPRHLGSMNAAFSTNYQFELFTMRVPGLDPNQVALSLRPDYTFVTNRTNLILSSDKYLLEPGVQYAWRVKAIAGEGELSLFQNDGYSEVFSFVYGSLCPIPENVKATILGNEVAKISWDADPVHTAFETRFRATGNDEAIWHTRESFVPSAKLKDILSPGDTYEYQVKAKTPTNSSDYTPLAEFTMPLAANEKFECGLKDSNNIDNYTPKDYLDVGDYIYNGQFPVKLYEVSGSHGVFSGKGRMRIPFLNNVQVNMEFKDIKVNELNQVYEGKLVSIYNPDSKFYIDDVTDYWSVGDQVGNIITGQEVAQIELEYIVDNPSDIVVVINDGKITVTNNAGGGVKIEEVETTTGGTTILDAAGNLYVVSEDGTTVTQVGKSGNTQGEGSTTGKGLASTSNNLDTEKVISFYNVDGDLWAFDTWDDQYESSSLISKEYEDINGYKVPWKLIPEGKSGKILAKVSKGDVDISKVVFKSGSGTEYFGKPKDGGMELTVVGSEHGDGQEIFALYPQGDSGFVSLGKFKVASYKMLVRKLFIVPVDELSVNADEIEKGVNDIFLKYGVEWDVRLSQPFVDKSWDKNKDGKLDAGESGTFSMYTAEMKALNTAYSSSHTLEHEAVYVFVLQESTGSAGILLGDMPLSSKFGYLFSPNDKPITSKTVAHEIAHGMFQLEHTFGDNYGLEKGITDNLMDYTNGTKLFKQQWDAMYDQKAMLFAWLQDEEDGQHIKDYREYLHLILEEYRRAFVNKAQVSFELPHKVSLLGATELKLYDGNETPLTVYSENPLRYKEVKLNGAQKIEIQKNNQTNLLIYPVATNFYFRIKEEDKERFEKYLYPHSNADRVSQIETYAINKIVAGISNEELEYYLVSIPKNDYDLIDFNKREISINKLLSSYVNTSGFNDVNEERLLVNLFRTSIYKKELYEFLQNDEIAYDIFDKIESHRKEFVYLTQLICEENWTPEDLKKVNKVFIGKDEAGWEYSIANGVAFQRTKNKYLIQNLKDHGAGGKIAEFTASPIQPVNLMYFDGTSNIVPAVWIEEIRISENIEGWKQAFFDYLNGLGISSAGRLLATKSVPKMIKFLAVIEFGKTSIDIAMQDEGLKENLKENGHEWFVENWNTISTITDISTLSIESIYSFAKNGKKVSETFRKHGKSEAADKIDEISDESKKLSRLTGIKPIDDFLANSPKIDNLAANQIPEGYEVFTRNGSKYIRRADISNVQTPRLMVDENGIIRIYTKPERLATNGKLRRNLENGLDEIPANHQAHHLVPDNVVRNSVLHKEAISRGLYDIDRATNGRLLAETGEDFTEISEAFPTHFGSHPNYDDAVKSAIDDVFTNNGINKNSIGQLSDQTITNLLDEIEDAALDILEDWQPSKLN